ncbi:pr168 [rat cytomegalovirus strain Maastricht]|uniref:Pr168 n=1 Tax=Rat cytomegalovirus (strain Maastricht) TaxID=79700 RepID=Q9DW26_RCMVM|nr:pr168 [rat cytomegalovirus strain Maastricht]AAF99264.1 pr168 [rat cytomegalovirus strain Maastricht]
MAWEPRIVRPPCHDADDKVHNVHGREHLVSLCFCPLFRCSRLTLPLLLLIFSCHLPLPFPFSLRRRRLVRPTCVSSRHIPRLRPSARSSLPSVLSFSSSRRLTLC